MTLISSVRLQPSVVPTHTAKYFGSDTHTHTRTGRWRVSLFSPSASIPVYFTYKNAHRGIEQIIYKPAPSLTYSYNTLICFFSIIKLALSSCFLLFLWHRDLCIMPGGKTGELQSISRTSYSPLHRLILNGKQE